MFKQSAVVALCFLCFWVSAGLATEYQTRDNFLISVFGEPLPPPQVLWLRGNLRTGVEDILGHRYAALRLRYWRDPDPLKDRSAWVLEEIGKELPITVGFVIEGVAIKSVQVLAYRESRGGEVRYPAFTRQFNALTLTQENQLSGPIDGISGATLSVSALKRLSRLALFLHQQTSHDH